MRALLASMLVVIPFAACECTDPGVGNADGGGPDGGPGGGVGVDGGGGFFLGDGGPFEIEEGGTIITDDDGGTQFVCYRFTCESHETACGNCIDDDGDGKTDWRDPECLGPCDNTEGPGLFSDVGGSTSNACGVDCYFDWGEGSGGGDCVWDHRCDPLEPEDICAPYESSRLGTNDCPNDQPSNCEDSCKPLTPNGCDCFGCCTFPQLDGGYVWIGNTIGNDNTSTCELAELDDATNCPRCTPVQGCLNACARCEVCIGKPNVPADCFTNTPPAVDGGSGGGADGGGGGGADGGGGSGGSDGGVVNPDQCPAGIDPCGLPGQPDCEPGFYCVSGCCRFIGG